MIEYFCILDPANKEAKRGENLAYAVNYTDPIATGVNGWIDEITGDPGRISGVDKFDGGGGAGHFTQVDIQSFIFE